MAGATVGPSVGIHLDEALQQIEQGNEVFILHCDLSIGGCMENPYWNPIYCKLCNHFQKKFRKEYLPKGIEWHTMSEYVHRIDQKSLPLFSYCNAKELRNLKYQGLDVGLGVMSTYISQTRNLNPEINEQSKVIFDALLREQVITAQVFKYLQKERDFDLVVFQNGRGAQFRALLNICQNERIDFLCTEYIVFADGHGAVCNYFNDIPHSLAMNNKKYADCWNTAKDTSKNREIIARSFFENRRNAIFAGDKIYVKDQKKGLLPDNWQEDIENIVIFNSSEDEFSAIGKEFDELAFFPSQLNGIKTIIEHYKGDRTKHFTLRIHPNLKNVPYKYHTDLYKLNYPNLTIVPADSPVSTYALMDAASKIIVFGSTTGIEAVYWGKPVICLAAAYYLPMDIVYFPKTLNELWGYIDTKKLSCKFNDQILKYGYFYMSDNHKRTKYVNIDLKSIHIFGRTYKCYSFNKWFGSNLLFMLLMRGYRKLFLNKFPAKIKVLSRKEA